MKQLIDEYHKDFIYRVLSNLEQTSLNQILSYDKGNKLHKRDYPEMLKKREKENIASRQNWTTVNTIKEIKEGYLSQVVHIITSNIKVLHRKNSEMIPSN